MLFVGLHTGWQVVSQSHRSRLTAPGEEHSKAPFPEGVLQSRPPHTTAQHRIWGLLLQQLGSTVCPQQVCDNHRANRRPHSTSSAGPGHHNTKHTPSKGTTASHTLRKDTAGIHPKNSPCTKNTGLTQSSHRYSHIKTALQDHSG